ncbi:hypothetical protein CCUS01_16095 [Colletotrichum cuscutae]|uniref:Uncharacterized protein n=1 Tax=Colletotrichum cuscutae TaxID=1209917 RepID=A0AAI9Y7B9_9PEZI|nr:hypothetical protein CCUS01_16095 [Colletotrichum cuscutae]
MSIPACPFNVSCNIEGPHEWQSNSDVAGLGVLIGFVGTAYIAFALILTNYFVAYDPEAPPPQQKRSIERQIRSTARRVLTGTETFTDSPVNPTYWTPNPIDVKLLAWLRLRTTKALEKCRIALPDFVTARPEQVRVGFNKSILNMCDAQILTGIGILTSGFISLDNSLSSLHWKMIAYLAWFSCVTHLSGLTVLRRHLQGESWARYTRLTLMLVLLVMLIVAMIPTAFFNWETGEKKEYSSAADFDTPAICFFSINCGKALYDSKKPEVPLSQTPAFLEMLISQTFRSFGFLARSIKLSTLLSDRLHRNIHAPLGKFVHHQLQRLEVLLYSREHTSTRTNASSDLESLRYGLIIRPTLALVIMFRTQADLFNSMLGEIFWLWVIVLWGTSKLAIVGSEVQFDRGI